MQPSAHLLCPRPQRCRQTEARFTPPNAVCLALPTELSVARDWVRAELAAWNIPIDDNAAYVIGAKLGGSHEHPTGYTLIFGEGSTEISAQSEAGLFYGVMTLLQWLRLTRFQIEARSARRRWWGLQVEDWPDLNERGVMLDISRNKVPKMGTLRALVDHFAEWKINQFQLYIEHTFAYSGHETVWQDASPMTAAELRELDDYCAARFIRLIPNQNTFGHFHRWLKHPAYRHLAECPEGIEHPFSANVEPFSLSAVDPRVDTLLDDLFTQLLPNFRANELNVGLDETFDLGLGSSKQACDELGKGRVYLDFLKRVHGLAAKHGCRIQFWGDIILDHPELIAEIPEDAQAMAWGYEADFDFDSKARAFAAANRRFYNCPGTSSWFSIAGRWQNAVVNLAEAALTAHAHGAEGVLITDWGDQGHLQPLPVSYSGFLAGAAFSWHVAEARDPLALDLVTLLDIHVFNDHAQKLGAIWQRLGNVYQLSGFTPANGSALFFLLRYPNEPMTHERLDGLNDENLAWARREIAATQDDLQRVALDHPCKDLLVDEARWAGRMLTWLCDYGSARLQVGKQSLPIDIDKPTKKKLLSELQTLTEERRRLWIQRNRHGGWLESEQNLAPSNLFGK